MLVNLLLHLPIPKMLRSFNKIFKVIPICIILFINIGNVRGQEWNSARITVLYGSNIPFNFNSMDKIKYDYPQSILIERQDNLRLIFIENSLK